ncbi:hypothetical protein O181_016933 [Austropuccinia psidii MF-1]|uniref:Uncharacterized protein n=1 Tax=Austropuccinia psidii MF-1 TaxID=1389203 RepID=A0A9Q3GRC6_9BASI|nr:hypothetical protein [Austropuccinia psidii MF-1]
MPAQNSPTAKNTRSQRHKAVLNPTVRAPLDRTPSVDHLSANFDRGPPMEGEAPSRKGVLKSRRSISFSGLLSGYQGISQVPRSRIGEAEDEEGEDFIKEEESEETEAFSETPKMVTTLTCPTPFLFPKIFFKPTGFT